MNEISAQPFACPGDDCNQLSLTGKGQSANILTVKALLSILTALSALLTAAGAEAVELRGRVICLAEEGKATATANHEHVWGFKTTDGKSFKLVRAKLSEALFLDKRLRERDLLLKGKISSDGAAFEPTAIHTVKNGIVHEVYYWCEICAIEAVAPEICVCCQGPVELVEKPMTK
jgi:hypothetical protein